jgi:hypothetical protein
MWRLLNRLKGARPKGEEDRVLVQNGRGYVGDGCKAKAFVSEYAKVSKLKIPKWGHRVHEAVSRDLRTEGPEPECGQPLKRSEVTAALDQMDGNKATGPDHLHPQLLKMLPPAAVDFVWKMFEASRAGGVVPQKWREARVVPILKAGKDPSMISSYRPISLLSALGKWLERVMANRIRFHLENSDQLCEQQAGFRPFRSIEDQLLRLYQDVSDGFERRERTVLATFDYAKAYDRVWKVGLLKKLTLLGLGNATVRWIRSWLEQRRAWVTVGQVDGERRLFREGLPQGAVLSPLLFLVYINDVVVNMPERVRVSIFADDLAVWARAKSVEEAADSVQVAASQIERWSERWLMQLSPSKCEVGVFSMDAADATAQPEIWVGGARLKVVAHPTFLGVTFDRRLTFQEHASRVIEKARKRVRMLRAVSGTDWGFSRELLRATYTAMMRSLLEYEAPAWAPWLSETMWQKLEVVQNEAARVIAGATSTSQTEAVLEEAGLPGLSRRGEVLGSIAYEKSRRMKDSNPGRLIAEEGPHKRLKKREWRKEAKKRWTDSFEEGQERMSLPSMRLMQMHAGRRPWRRIWSWRRRD